MRKLILLIFTLLLTSVSGVWAGTPTTDAYPIVGKTYYLYAIQTDGSRSYIYNDNGTLKVSNGSKTDANNYKWTVTKSGDYYYIANVAGNKLCTSNASGFWNLSLNSNGQTFDLRATVSDGACVSLKASNYWWVTPKASGAYPNANYYLSSYGTNAAYSANYVFEEVLSAHSLTAGAYYTIYCDNDSKQYFYDNGSALAVGSSSRSQNYVWICKKNGDYYNLQNAQTEKYMGWKNVQAGAYDLIIGTEKPNETDTSTPKSTGMATIYGPNANATNDGRFLVMGYDNAFSQSTITYEKGSTNFSADFRFTRVKIVTFNKPVAVDGGSAVSIISVATDGSDSFTLPTQYKYTISGVAYDAIEAVGIITAAGTANISVTVSDFLENDKLYRIEQAWQSNRYYLYSNTSDGSNGNRLWKNKTVTANTLLTDGKYIWQAKSSSSNWKIYNPTSTRYIAKATTTSSDGTGVNGLSATSADDAETFTIETAVTCGYPPSDFGLSPYVALKSNTKTTWLNSYSTANNYVGWHNAVHAGYYFRFIPVKTVTFSQAVAVNGGSAVTTIYVAKDGSDSFTLPSGYRYTFGGNDYYGNGAAEAIAAAGSDDISVTVSDPTITSLSDLSNSKCYYINNVDTQNNRGDFCVDNDGTYVSSTANAATSTSRNTDEKKRFAIILKDEKYYLWSVSEKKFVSKPASLSGGNVATTLTNDPDNALTLEIHAAGVSDGSVTHSGKWKFSWSETSFYFNMSSQQLKVYANGASPDAGTLFDIIEAENFDATEALDRFNENSVTYILKYSGNEVGRTTITVNRGPAVIPASLDNGFMTYTYDPETIIEGTTEVIITATWNGPFQYAHTYNASTAKWYTVGIHTAHEGDNHIWKYNSDDEKLYTESVSTDAYGSVTNNHLFCFVGNPYNGFSIYNKTVGDSKTIYKSATNGEQALMSTTGSLFVPDVPTQNGKTVASGYACFKLKDGTTRLNCYDSSGYKVYGWGDSGNGSTCWFLPEGQYYLNFLNEIVLDAPIGAVGTPSCIRSEDARTSFINYKNSFTEDIFYLDGLTVLEKGQVKTVLGGVGRLGNITLSDGYYRIISAVSGFNQTAAWYYNPSVSADHITWAKAATTSEQQVNSIFKFEASGDDWNIKSPNAQKYLIHDGTAFGAQTGTIGDEPGIVYVNAIGSAQHTLKINEQTIHANGHNSGSGTSGTLINWNANDPGAASTWYIVKVEDIDLGLNAAGDDFYYATMCLPFDVTLASACAYTLTLNGAKNGLTLSSAISEVPAGTPVLIRYSDDEITATINTGAAFNSGSPLDCALTGTYVDKSVTGDTDYFLGVNSSDEIGFYHWGTGTKTLDANRAYFEASKLSGAVKGLSLIWDEETGINSIENGKWKIENEAVYDLSGRRVAKPTKGLYIKNGKKTVIK